MKIKIFDYRLHDPHASSMRYLQVFNFHIDIKPHGVIDRFLTRFVNTPDY